MVKRLAAILFLVVASCGGSSSTGASQTPTPASAATVAAASNAKLGTILVDGSGRTLYLFEADRGMSSTCYNACATYWPPLLTNGAPVAGTGVQLALLWYTQPNDR